MRMALAGWMLGFVATAAAAQTTRPEAKVESGRLAGTAGEGVEVFKGIPYAAPPVGPLRWRAPQPAAAWQGVRDASRFGHDCVQDYWGLQPPGSEPAEDCLFLNVWRPAGAGARRLPVMVWIHGGGFTNGSTSRQIYVGDRLARQGIVVVSLNYRLGRFGTFAHPALTREKADGDLLANYGYMDQLAALKWVRRNVAAFGGDPDKVTLVGESAGGMSIHALVTSPMARGLFRGAVIASGGAGAPIRDATLADAEAIGAAFGQAQGIAPDAPDALVRLRAVPAAVVLGGITMNRPRPGPPVHSSPFVDGKLAVDAGAAYRAGAFARVPMIIGATSGDLGGRDGPMVAGARQVSTLLAGKGVPVWYYRFSYVSDAATTPKEQGAVHADDLPYYFDAADEKYGASTRPRDMAVGGLVSRYVANFMKTGDPNGSGLPQWPAYRGAGGTMMDFTLDGAAVAAPDPWAAGGAAMPVAKPVDASRAARAGM